MTKQSGLGDNCYVGGYNLSGDIGQIKTIGSPMKPIDTTGIDKSGHERIPGLRDGMFEFIAFYNPSSNQEHPVLSVLPTIDVSVYYARGTTLGAPAACMIGKQIDYKPSRGSDGSFTFDVQFQANGYGLEWGTQLTAGIRTDTAATNGASVDGGNGFATPAVAATTIPVTNTSPLPATVVISAGTLTNVSVNGVTAGTGDGTYTVPAGGTITLTYSVAPTWTWALQTSNGWQAYLQLFGFTGTDATVTLQDSADNSSWTNIASGAFAQITAGRQTQRLAVGSTAAVRRYVRAITSTSAGFSNLAFAVMLNKNQVATGF
ncbi:MAG TPA: hypothetical protein VHX38_18945 [Pseudonocardiaceae bacterium]|jgi:hypothetical protein|nr:hypothetical protein [Pseudonocardiaceae bacterium]